MKARYRSLVNYCSVGLFLILIDRITKSLIIHYFEQCDEPYDITSFISFTCLYNRGVSWSMLHSSSNLQFIVVTSLVICIACGLFFYARSRFNQGFTIFGETLALAGALSNIVDRFLYGGVLDFILIHFQGWVWPVFNCADAFIVCGVLLMILHVYLENAPGQSLKKT